MQEHKKKEFEFLHPIFKLITFLMIFLTVFFGSIFKTGSIVSYATSVNKKEDKLNLDLINNIKSKFNFFRDGYLISIDGKDIGVLKTEIFSKPLITVETVEEIEYEKDIDYDCKIKYDESMYKNEKKIKKEGVPGKSRIVEKIIKHNGEEVDRKIVKEEVISKPVDKLVIRGTKQRPKTVATGSFVVPTQGYLSSKFGMRWGRMHRGIDIATQIGTPIKAADGGRVTYSGARGNYGNIVEINHENGYVTRYAHCSKLHVNVGDKVHKGQNIASVGNTGRTTGPHLHFEVIKNGVHQNPANYLKR